MLEIQTLHSLCAKAVSEGSLLCSREKPWEPWLGKVQSCVDVSLHQSALSDTRSARQTGVWAWWRARQLRRKQNVLAEERIKSWEDAESGVTLQVCFPPPAEAS